MAAARWRYSCFHHPTQFSELDCRVGWGSHVEGQLDLLQKNDASTGTAIGRIGCGAECVVYLVRLRLRA